MQTLTRGSDMSFSQEWHMRLGPDDIVEWFHGSGLRPFLEPLSPCERETFLSRYRAELSAAYPRQPDGKMLIRACSSWRKSDEHRKYCLRRTGKRILNACAARERAVATPIVIRAAYTRAEA